MFLFLASLSLARFFLALFAAHSCGQVRLILRSSRLNLAIKGAVGLRRANVALLGDVLL